MLRRSHSLQSSSDDEPQELRARSLQQKQQQQELQQQQQQQQQPSTNPFVNGTYYRAWSEVPRYEIFKWVVLGATLAPVRLLLTVLIHLLACLIAGLFALFLSRPVREAKQPLPAAVRLALFTPLQLLARLQLLVWGYHWIDVKGGKPASRDAAPIVVANHTTFVDAYFLWAIYGAVPVAKAEVGAIPLVGTLTRVVQTVFVSRGDSKSRNETLDAIKRRATSSGWPQIMIFPEGTCENGSSLITFKQGAFHPGVPVQPVALKYRWQHFDPCWVSYGPGPGALLLRMLCQFDNRLEVTFLPVRSVSDMERANASLYADHVRHRIASVLEVPVTNYVLEDMMLVTSVNRLGRPADTVNVQFQQLRKLHEVGLGDVQVMLDKFATLDTDKDGKIDYDEFLGVLDVIGIEESEFTKQIFQMLDADQSGTLDFNEFVVGLVQYSRNYSHRESVELALRVFGLGDEAVLTRSDLQLLFQRFEQVQSPTVDQLLRSLDSTGAGRIGREDFINYASERPEIGFMFRHYERREGLTQSTRHLRVG